MALPQDAVLFKNAYFAFGASTSAYVNYSQATKALQMPLSKAELANSVMGDLAETFEQGLESCQISATFRQDFSASGVDAKTYAAWKAGTKLYTIAKPVNAATSTTNPEFRFKLKIYSITPISGSHGELLGNEVSFRLVSTTSTGTTYNGVTRATAS